MPGLCGVARVMLDMSDEDKRALSALLHSPISAKSVALELQSAGYRISYQTVYRHRTATCSCDVDE